MMKTLGSLTLAAAALCASNARAASVSIDLDVQAPGFDPVALRARLTTDLGQPVGVPGEGNAIHLFVTEVNGKIIVGLSEGTRQVTRQVELPVDRAVAQETLELLLAAMTRTESIEPPASPPVVTQTLPAAPRVVAPVAPVAPAAPPGVTMQAPATSKDEEEHVMPAAIDLVPFVGFSSASRARDTRFFSIGAVGSVARNVHGMGVNGVVGVATGDVRGVQIAGVVNVIGADSAGAQIAGTANVAGDVYGAQISGVINVARELEGVQIGGVVNIAHVDGAQIAGVVNVASGSVHGMQLGLVNVADESDAPIGLVNIIAKGRHHVDVWGSETGLVMAGGQLGGKYTHAILGVGMRPGPDGARFAFGGGIGFHADLGESVGLDFDLLHHDLSAFVAQPKLVQLSQARLLFDFAIVRGLRLFAGPTFNVLVSNDPTDTNPSVYGSWSVSHSSDVHVAIWPGVTVGSRLL